MDRIDLRSDTVTWPTPEMRRAMAEAVVGDDVFGEDPTVNALQEAAARRLGKEAGLFVASGTMGNLVAVLAHCGRGDEVILGDRAHTFVYEAGGIAALGVDVADLVAAADSVTFCLSKGLCAPVGSVLVGSRDFIARAHRVRKLLGGGMRQTGILAAAGLIALDRMTLRLAEDHANARRLAEGLAALPQIDIALERVQTNMVFFALRPQVPLSAPQLAERLRRHNVWIMDMGERGFRAVTHYWIHPQDVDRALSAIAEELS